MKRLVVAIVCYYFLSGIATCVANDEVFTSTTPRRALITHDICFKALAANDVNEDDRINRPEYVDLVNDLGEDAWSNLTSYNQLPPFLRSIFLDLYFESSNSSSSSPAGQGVSFDVFGSKPNQVANTTQQQFLTDVVCTKIPAAIRTLLNNDDDDDDTNTTSLVPTPTPSSSSSGGTSMAPTVSPSNDDSFNDTLLLTECFTDLAMADADKNNFLDMQEYVTFVQEYSSITLQFDTFDDLPLLLRANFLSLASDETNIFKISEESDMRIFGVHGNQTARPKQYKYLQLVCRQTNQVLNVVEEMIINDDDKPSNSAIPTSAPTDSPAPTMTPSPTNSPTITPVPTTVPLDIALLECLFSLGLSDMDQDKLLNQTEYVAFVNYRSNKWFDGFLYEELPTVLQVNFVALANNNRNGGLQGVVFQNTSKENINVTGYNYPDVDISSEQLDFLQLVCRQTDQVLESLTGLLPPNVSPPPTTMAPTTAPSTPPPAPTMTPTVTSTVTTTAPSTLQSKVQIVSNFHVSNTKGLTASNLVGSTNQEDLREAYDMTAVQVVERIQTLKEEQPSTASNLRRLKKKNRRLVVEYVVDSGTIDTIKDTPCPASAPSATLCQSVAASFTLLVTNETEVDVDLHTTEINDAIRTGELQQHLDKVNPDSPIVIGVPEGTTETTDTGGNSNMNADNVDGQIILIICVAIAGSVILVAGTVLCIDRRKKKRVKREGQQDVVDGPAVIASSQIVQQSSSQDFSKPTQQQPQDGIPPEQWPRENSRRDSASRATLGPTHDQDHVAPPPPQQQHSGVHDHEESSCLSAEVIHYDDSLSQVLEHIDNNEMYLPIEGSVSSEEADWTPPFRQIT